MRKLLSEHGACGPWSGVVLTVGCGVAGVFDPARAVVGMRVSEDSRPRPRPRAGSTAETVDPVLRLASPLRVAG